jgi:hypothetical protein
VKDLNSVVNTSVNASYCMFASYKNVCPII